MAIHMLKLSGILLVVCCHNLLADTKYVTDDLQLSLHEKSNSKGRLLEKEDGLFARVKTPDGKVGWTKAAFLVDEKPARAQLLELRQTYSQMQQELQTTQDQLEASNNLTAQLRAEKIQVALELAQERENKQHESTALGELKQEVTQLRERLGTPEETRIPLSWGLIGTAVSLLLGFIGGIALFDWMSRRRHGGYRIY